MIVLTILAVIVIFSVLVLIHEFGHFVMARRAGIKVEEFGIGFPPRLFSKKKGETIYSVNAIPFGGFVRLFGEDAVEGEALHNKRSFICQSRWVRAKVIVAGVVMNFVLAVALLTVGFIFGIEPLLVTENDLSKHLNEGNVTMAPGVFVGKVSEAAEKLGIRTGDQILRIDDEPITQTGQIVVFEKGKAAKDADLKLKSQDGSERDIHVPLTNKEHSYGIELKPFTEFPRLAVLEVKGDSASSRAGLLRGDVIISVNGLSITSSGQLDDVLATAGFAEYAVLRGERIISVKVTFDDARKVVISEVTRKSAAEEAGFHTGDAIVAMDSVVVTRP
ncbi:site-2 protease family protein [Candidatus Peregrinibacteria bacterium]|nr:site-2 protease family protein [Candidatus Peregrinibacteria bacterium]